MFDGTMAEAGERADANPVLAFVDSCLRGVGQVVFMNNPLTGLAILIAMFWHKPWLGFAGCLGLVVSTLAAILIGMDRGAIRAGLFGFNGVLVGAGLSLFLQPDWDIMVMVWIVMAAFLSTILHAALAAVFVGSWTVPPFTLAFNFITLIFLIGALNFANGRVGGLIAPADAQVTQGSVSNTLRSAADTATANTLPFCFATLTFVLLKAGSNKLVPIEVADITTPEEHLRRGRDEHSAGVGRDAAGVATA